MSIRGAVVRRSGRSVNRVREPSSVACAGPIDLAEGWTLIHRDWSARQGERRAPTRGGRGRAAVRAVISTLAAWLGRARGRQPAGRRWI
jgi:hypothetical protein